MAKDFKIKVKKYNRLRNRRTRNKKKHYYLVLIAIVIFSLAYVIGTIPISPIAPSSPQEIEQNNSYFWYLILITCGFFGGLGLWWLSREISIRSEIRKERSEKQEKKRERIEKDVKKRTCEFCGKLNSKNVAFCHSCGARLESVRIPNNESGCPFTIKCEKCDSYLRDKELKEFFCKLGYSIKK